MNEPLAFFELSCESKRTALHFDADIPKTDDMLAKYESLAWGGWHPSRPIIHRSFTGGARVYDMHGTTMATTHLVSQRFVSVLREQNATGWTPFPVEAYGKRKERLEGLCGLSVTGKCGPILWESCRIARRGPIRPGLPARNVLVGLHFEAETWDGSSLFMARGFLGIFLTEQVQRALKKAKLKNMKMIPLSEVEFLAFGEPLERAKQGARARGEALPSGMQ